MTDIVEQLRDLQSGAQWVCGETAATLEDAADEIERLREEGAEAAVMSNRANNRATSLQMEVYYLKAEIERLRKALRRIATNTGCVEACPCWAKLRRKAERALLEDGR